MNHPVIETKGLQKSFKGRAALNGLDLEVPRGSIFGFLGLNGAGKTTTIKILMGILQPTGGHVRVLGAEPGDSAAGLAARQRIGFVTEDKELYPYMSVRQMIGFTRSFYPKWRDDLESRYLKLFDLPLSKKLPDLSKGMRSKLMLLLAISRGAELLILDEPTDGMDPAATEALLRELVAIAAAEGTTIFFSSHQLPEVEQIADRICIINRGRTAVTGVLDDLKSQCFRYQIVLPDEIAAPVKWAEGIKNVRQEGRTLSFFASGNVEAIMRQVGSLSCLSVERFPVTLKEIFLEEVGENAGALV